jgi:hypothetical protein
VGPSPQDYECCTYVGTLYALLFREDVKDSLFAPASYFQPVSRFHITSVFEIENADRSIHWVKLATNFRFVPSARNDDEELVPRLIGLGDAFIPVLYINPETTRNQITEWRMEGL